jgi:acyl-CoA synthetase (AMP-forming)/AMP-acid ligase II
MDLWAVTADDVVINALPLFHVHGLGVCLLGALARGATTRLVPRFTPAAVVAAARGGATVFMSVPTMVHRIIAAMDDDAATALGSLRLVTCGSAALSAEHLRAFAARTGVTILERYGMTETLITLSNPLEGERRPGAVGWPVPGTEIRVVDDELQVRSIGTMKGYWNRPDADAESFVEGGEEGRWFKTGDVVTRDDDGCVRIVGRASQDILKVGGYKLSTREIEEQLETHPAVREVAVVGLADVEWGERVCAVVALHPGATLTLAEAQAHVQLAEVKRPRELVLVDALPRTALGKVMKSALKPRG